MKKYSLLIFILLWIVPCQIFAQTIGTRKWSFYSGTVHNSSPSLDDNGTIYFGDTDNNSLFALNPDGTKKWAFITEARIDSSPAIGIDGTIYIGSRDGRLYAINPDGTQKWAFETQRVWDNDIWSSPAIGADGTIYIGSWDNNFYAVNPDGTQKWTFRTEGKIWSSPAIGEDGTIYVGSNDGKLYAITPKGAQKWAFKTDGYIESSPAIGTDGTIYVGSNDNYIYAISPDGAQKWAFKTEGQITSSPAIGIDGTIYVGSWDHNLYAINPNGTLKWTFETDMIQSSPAIGVDGTIYFGSWDKNLYAINPDGTKRWIFPTGGWVNSSPVIAADGTIYVGSRDKKLYAIYSDSMGLAMSPWPKFHANKTNTGAIANKLIISAGSNFTIANPNTDVPALFSMLNTYPEDINITNCAFSNSGFSLDTPLPALIAPGESMSLMATIAVDATGLYKSTLSLSYEVKGETQTASVETESGIFVEDGSETTYIAHHAMDAYNASRVAETPNSAAIQNNLGVLYRLLGAPIQAENSFLIAVRHALNDDFGYTGVKMNLGVVKSDQGFATEAHEFYDLAEADINDDDNNPSVNAPRIFYNQAWELFKSTNYTDALSKVNQTIIHVKTNAYLKAKAYTLRGNIYAKMENWEAAKADFLEAMLFDPDGPIGRMAEDNLGKLQVTGSLTITLEPQVAIDAGAMWRVDGGEWKSSGAVVSGLTPESHSVTFKSVAGWNTPAAQTVTVTENQTKNITATYAPQTGSIKTTLEPQNAINAGAMWRVDGGEWKSSGVVISGLTPGSHTVSFKDVAGWNTPAAQTVTVTENQTKNITGTYVPQTGSIKTTLEPQNAINAGAMWRVDGGEWKSSGAVVSGLTPGSHSVTFKSVAGWNTPVAQTVTVTENQIKNITGTYVPQTGSIKTTLEPQNAIDAGAMWRVDGGEWKSSGVVVSGLTPGSHSVSFKDVTGWNTPAAQAVIITANQTQTIMGTYKVHLDLAFAIQALQIMAGMNPPSIRQDIDINNDDKIGMEEVIYVLQIISKVRVQ